VSPAARDVNIRDGSNPAFPRHPRIIAYRCYLPVLTGFTRPRRAGPSSQHRKTDFSGHVHTVSIGDFSLAIADCEFRAPLTPRLARSVKSYYCSRQSSLFSKTYIRAVTDRISPWQTAPDNSFQSRKPLYPSQDWAPGFCRRLGLFLSRYYRS